MNRSRSIGSKCADPQSAIVGIFDFGKTGAVDVDEFAGGFDLQLHQVEQVGAARNRHRIRTGDQPGGIAQGAGTFVLEGPHALVSVAASRIAATMLA